MNELICTQCFANKPRYLRQCRCLYCEECRQKCLEVCDCGGSGGWHDLNQQVPDEIKCLSLDNAQLLKKTMDSTQEKICAVMHSSFRFLNEILDMKSHHQRQLQKFLTNKVKVVTSENESLKKKGQRSEGFEAKENLISFSGLDEFKFSTPRGARPTVPLSNSKKPFDHEGFASFFTKKT